MKPQMLKALAAGVITLIAASPAAANIVDPDAAATVRTEEMFFVPAEAASSPGEDGDILFENAAIPDDELDGQRGGQTIQITNQTMTAITSGNILNGDYMAGDVTLSDNALSNFNGIGNLLINTGAQVSLQTGMNFTINVGD